MTGLTEFEKITTQFQIPGKFSRAKPFGHGHINDTFLARFDLPDGSARDYVVQRINHNVFRQPAEVLTNIVAITAHLCEKIEAAGGDPTRETLTLIPTHAGSFLHISSDGSFWRIYAYIENVSAYQVPASQAHVYHAGKAFGNFACLLSDFPVDTLHETIPDFHNTPVRYQAFQAAVNADRYQRAAGAAAEIGFVHQRVEELGIMIGALEQGKIPLRVTHNDTKFNNVMIDDQTGEAICIVDLDTVMPGSLLFDFGDAIRSIANTAAEDEPNLDIVHFDLETYENFTRGFLEATGNSITQEEYALLPFSARLMTIECGIRFLTDHLNGDEYFRISRDGHNLDRCRTQFRLVEEMENRFPEMKQIIRENAPTINIPPGSFIG
jgi:hypothetical protein